MISKNDLRIVYMGTPQFAVEPLRAILGNGYQVAAVVTTPDKPAGRGQKLSQSAVKIFAESQNLKVLQPEKLKDQVFINELNRINPHIIIVVAFRMLPEIIWQIPSMGTFNLHASLLPQYRGAAPINWAIINGEHETGITTFLIDQKIDTGGILLNKKVSISPSESAGELHDRLMLLGGELVVNTIELLSSGNAKAIPQEQIIDSNIQIKSAPKLFKETTRIDWNRSATEIHNLIRGLSPYPAAWCELQSANGQTTTAKIFRSQVVDNKIIQEKGTIESDGKTFINVQCGEGQISISEIQLAGKKNLSIKDFLLGFREIENFKFV
jgi:methionyl-tRNA formyltransferase